MNWLMSFVGDYFEAARVLGAVVGQLAAFVLLLAAPGLIVGQVGNLRERARVNKIARECGLNLPESKRTSEHRRALLRRLDQQSR